MKITIASLIFASSFAYAAPWASEEPTPTPTPGSAPDSTSCNNESGVVSCCNTDNGLLGVLGALCTIDVLAFLNPSCASGSAFCCPTTEQGIINVGSICVPITGA